MTELICVEGLSKQFGPHHAVLDVNFNVKQGEILGLLGPNGAGKSTTIKMLTCYLRPTSGSATICGHSILDNTHLVRSSMGYMPETSPLYGEMMVKEFLTFMGEMRNLKKEKLQEAIERVVNLTNLQDVFYQTLETLSKGYKKRVLLAQALIHDPKILILDEPTDGLDPNQKGEVRSMIRKLSEEKAILISTHILEELEALCTDVLIMSKGKIQFKGTTNELMQKCSERKLNLQDYFRCLTLTQ